MPFTNYTDFRNRVIALLAGDEPGANSSVSSATVDAMIEMGEARVYAGDDNDEGLRASCMEEPLNLAVASNAVTLPADLLQVKEVYFSGYGPLERIPLDRLRMLEQEGVSGGVPRYYAQDGDTLRFWPQASGTLLGRYWKRPAGMETVTPWANNEAVARYPELFLYAALAESGPFYGDDARIPIWEGKLRAWRNAAKRTEAMRASGGPMRVRSR